MLNKKQAAFFYSVMAVWLLNGFVSLWAQREALRVENLSVNGPVQVAAQNYYSCTPK